MFVFFAIPMSELPRNEDEVHAMSFLRKMRKRAVLVSDSDEEEEDDDVVFNPPVRKRARVS